MAFLFVLALLLDSACAAACIPAELGPPAEAKEDCSEGHHGGSRESCNLRGHLKPVVKDRTATTAIDAPLSLESPTDAIEGGGLAPNGDALVRACVLQVPPLLKRSSVLRI